MAEQKQIKTKTLKERKVERYADDIDLGKIEYDYKISKVEVKKQIEANRIYMEEVIKRTQAECEAKIAIVKSRAEELKTERNRLREIQSARIESEREQYERELKLLAERASQLNFISDSESESEEAPKKKKVVKVKVSPKSSSPKKAFAEQTKK